jgi:hypothetical protein
MFKYGTHHIAQANRSAFRQQITNTQLNLKKWSEKLLGNTRIWVKISLCIRLKLILKHPFLFIHNLSTSNSILSLSFSTRLHIFANTEKILPTWTLTKICVRSVLKWNEEKFTVFMLNMKFNLTVHFPFSFFHFPELKMFVVLRWAFILYSFLLTSFFVVMKRRKQRTYKNKK